MTRLFEIRKKVNEFLPKEKRISIFAFVVKAYSVALLDFPIINSKYFPDRPHECTLFEDHNVSVAIDTPIGLVAPNIKSVQTLSVA